MAYESLRAPLPSDVVNALQKDGLPYGHVFDAIMLLWLPTHEDCHKVYRYSKNTPSEIYDAAVSCIEGLYDPDSRSGRIPTHAPRF